MSTLSADSEEHIVVRSTVASSGPGDSQGGVQVASVLFSGLLIWRFAWPLITAVVVNPWLILLCLVFFAVITCFITFKFFGWLVMHLGFERIRHDANQGNTTVSHWTISDRFIKRHYPNHYVSTSINSINSVSNGDDHFKITYQSGLVEKLPFAGFDSDEQRIAALAKMSAITSGDQDSAEELEDSIELESCYSKESLKVLESHGYLQKRLRDGNLKRGVILGAVFLCFLIADALINGNRMKPVQIILFVLMTNIEWFFHWLPASFTASARTARHFWRVSLNSFRFGTRTGRSCVEIVRKWSDLDDIVETREGLILKFSQPFQVTLLPKRTVSLRTWDEAVHAIRELGGFTEQSRSVQT